MPNARSTVIVTLLVLHTIDLRLIFSHTLVKLDFDLQVNKAFVVLKVLLYMHLEFDHVIKDLFDLGMQFLAQGVGAKSQLLKSIMNVSF